ncbi:MAG: DUF2264 domain-containing protein [Acidobacteria bacterium]|nr:DUF2264 domain-containing protein [Acidobacteriota bacterium]
MNHILASAPERDYSLSPYTGYTRQTWEHIADSMLLSTRQFVGPGNSRLVMPGAPGGYGTDVDGLEGFARTFMAAAFRLAGSRGEDNLGLAEWYAEGIASGTDPSHPYRWVRPDEHDQAKVEAAAIALGLSMTRALIWDRLDDRVKANVVDWLSTVIGAKYPPINWVWFRIVVEQFLRSVGASWSREDMEADLALHDTFVRDGGWYSDGTERSFDHYAGWALHLYPVLWLQMANSDDEYAGPRREAYLSHLDRYLEDAVRLVGRDGSPLVQGRSLIYRFAAAAPFWAGAMSGSSTLVPGTIRRAASGMLKHFADAGAFGADGVLTLGWHGQWRKLAQSYSGPGSPYWASKGLLGLALPADHPVWTEKESPLPIDESDVATVAAAPGWLISGTASDGIIRVINHGTDHSHPGAAVTDAPLYARFGYSTATSPVLDPMLEQSPLDQSVVLIDSHGRPSHRAGFRTVACRALDDGMLLGASVSQAHWVDPDPHSERHGYGAAGQVIMGPSVATVSLVRGAWELRFVRVATEDGVESGRLRLGGWPLSSDAPHTSGLAEVSSAGLSSVAVGLGGLPAAGVQRDSDASPLGQVTSTPWLETQGTAKPGIWHVAALALTGSAHVATGAPRVRFLDGDGGQVEINWTDGLSSALNLSEVIGSDQ